MHANTQNTLTHVYTIPSAAYRHLVANDPNSGTFQMGIWHFLSCALWLIENRIEKYVSENLCPPTIDDGLNREKKTISILNQSYISLAM